MPLARLYQRQTLVIQLPLAVVGIALAIWLWFVVFPIPPTTVTMSTGNPSGAYHRNALRYVDAFAARGVTLHLEPSAGSEQNLERLRAGTQPTDLAFVQGGYGYLGDAFEGSGPNRVETLANIDIEPVWLFSRSREIDAMPQLQGLRVAVGPEGSGNRRVATKLIEQARLDPKDITLSPLAGQTAVQALIDGTLDIVIMVSSPDSPLVRSMLAIPGIHLANLRKSTAIIERNPFLEQRLLPQGSLGPKQPPRDITMLTTSASLVAREQLHPALKRLAISVANDVHGGAGLFHRAGDFPSLRRIDFPTAAVARTTLLHGLPWLENALPFWWAQVAERLLFIVLPVAFLVLWLMHVLSSWLRWWLESRVNRWYGELKFIENDLRKQDVTGLDVERFLLRLQAIDKTMMAFSTPRELMARCYTLHQHINFVRRQLDGLRGR